MQAAWPRRRRNWQGVVEVGGGGYGTARVGGDWWCSRSRSTSGGGSEDVEMLEDWFWQRSTRPSAWPGAGAEEDGGVTGGLDLGGLGLRLGL